MTDIEVSPSETEATFESEAPTGPEPELLPPPYSEAPAMYPPPQTEGEPPVSGDESFPDTRPEDPTEATPSEKPSPFDDDVVRKGFVRKVFCILTLQLLFTFSVVCVFTFSSVVKEAVQSNIWVYVSSYIIFAVVAISLTFCGSFRRRHPWNIIGLTVVTLSMSYMVGTMASYHNTPAVIITMASTLVISFAIIAYSIQTRYSFSICYGLLLVLVVDILMFGFFCTFYYNYVADVAYGSLGALVFALFLTVDCQLVIGRESYGLDPEEYVFAALIIYLDIVLIFMYLLGKR